MPTQSKSRQAPHIGSQTGSGYIWLAYSIFFFIDPILRHSSRYWAQSLATYAVFLALYIGYTEARTARQRHILIGSFYLLGMLVLPFNGGASSFFIYCAAFLPFVVESVSLFAILMAAQFIGIAAEGYL